MRTAGELNDLGGRAYLRGNWEEAKAYYVSALRLDPNYIPTLMNYARLASDQNWLMAAKLCFLRLHQLQPSVLAHQVNLGSVYARMGDFLPAFELLSQATKIAPDMADAWHNMVILCHNMGLHAEALQCCRQLEALGISNPALQNDRAHVHLALGDLASAWVDYEARWTMMDHMPPWDHHIPEWQGEALAGKRILFHGEQGYGDSIMCSRFARNLRNLGAKVTLCLPEELLVLFAHQDWGIDLLDMNEVPANANELFDFHSPMYSAMRHLKLRVSDIEPSPFLSPPEPGAPSAGDGLKIGICWASGRRNTKMDYRRREAPLEDFLRLAEIPGARLFSLQKGENEADIEQNGFEAFVCDETGSLRDWADTARYVAGLDAVVCVDTAIAHLAGALGVRTIMLAQYVPCWRWWGLREGNGLPWYENFTIIRQQKLGDWATQIVSACEILRNEARTDRIAA